MITVIIVCDHVMFFVYCTYGLYSVSFMIFLMKSLHLWHCCHSQNLTVASQNSDDGILIFFSKKTFFWNCSRPLVQNNSLRLLPWPLARQRANLWLTRATAFKQAPIRLGLKGKYKLASGPPSLEGHHWLLTC